MDLSNSSFGEWQIVSINGKFVMKAVPYFRKYIENLEKEGSRIIAVDLSGTTHLDSSAIASLMQYSRQLVEKNGKLVIFGANEDITGIINIVGLDCTMPFYKTKSDFIKSIYDNAKK
jgi:anti-anti-sigma factor